MDGHRVGPVQLWALGVTDRKVAGKAIVKALQSKGAAGANETLFQVLTLVRDACFAAVDCNGNQVVDSCDIVNGGSLDCDFDGTPDEWRAWKTSQ